MFTVGTHSPHLLAPADPTGIEGCFFFFPPVSPFCAPFTSSSSSVPSTSTRPLPSCPRAARVRGERALLLCPHLVARPGDRPDPPINHTRFGGGGGLSSSRDRTCQLCGGWTGFSESFPDSEALSWKTSSLSLSHRPFRSTPIQHSLAPPNPTDLSWRGEQAKCAVAARSEPSRAPKSCFASPGDSIAMIRATITHRRTV